MGTILIDKLLSAQVKQGASDLHIAVGQPPVLRLHGRMRKLETKVLEPDDTMALMKSITPERCQQELQETGGADFGFAFGDQARFRVSIFRRSGNVAMVLRQIPNKMLTMEQLGLPDGLQRPDHAAPRAVPGHRARPARARARSLASDGQLHQRDRRSPHHHDRRPDRVLSQPQEVDDQSARGRRRRPQLRRGDSPRAAAGPRRDPGRRNARPGNDRSGHHRGRNGPRRVRHAAHHQRRRHDQPHHRRVPHATSRTRSARSLPRRSSASCRPAAAAARSAAAASRRTRCWSSRPASPT